MPEDDGRPVVERLPVVGEAVDRAIQRGQHRRPRRHKQIDAEVDRAPLIGITSGGTVLCNRVPPAGFIIPANPDAHPGSPHPFEQRVGDTWHISGIDETDRVGAAGTEIKDQVLPFSQVGFHHRADGICVGFEPAHHCGRSRAGGHPAGLAEGGQEQPRAQLGQEGQGGPGRARRDGEVLVIRLDLPLMGRDGHARAQSHGDEVVQELQLMLR